MNRQNHWLFEAPFMLQETDYMARPSYRQNHWLFEAPFMLQETDYMARSSSGPTEEQIDEIKSLTRQIADIRAHRKRSGQSSRNRHQKGLARNQGDRANSAILNIRRGSTTYDEVVERLRKELDSLNKES